MQLNKIPAISYEQGEATLAFVLNCDFEQALSLDGEVLSLTDETSEDAELAYYGGYHLTGLAYTLEGYVRATFAKVIAPDVRESISSLEKNLTITNRNVSDATDTANNAASASQQNAEAIEALNTSFEKKLSTTNQNVTNVTDMTNRATRVAAAANTAAEQNAEAIEALITLINPSFEE